MQLRFYKLVGDMPPRRATWDNFPRWPTIRTARAFREQLERARPVPKVPEWERIANQLAVIGERMAHGELTAGRRRQPRWIAAPTRSWPSDAG